MNIRLIGNIKSACSKGNPDDGSDAKLVAVKN